jgi:hypothetical protein
MTVGQDVEHGIWAIAGAREGCYRTLCTQWDFKQVRDFKVLEQLWISTSNSNSMNAQDAKQKCISLGKTIKERFQMEFPTEPYDAESSEFFKKVYINSPRTIRKTV